MFNDAGLEPILFRDYQTQVQILTVCVDKTKYHMTAIPHGLYPPPPLRPTQLRASGVPHGQVIWPLPLTRLAHLRTTSTPRRAGLPAVHAYVFLNHCHPLLSYQVEELQFELLELLAAYSL